MIGRCTLPADLAGPEREAAIIEWAIRTGAYTEIASTPTPTTADSGCITGLPCALGCGLFCALEPEDG